MSLKDLFDGIGNAFSVVWGLIKDLFYQVYTSEITLWIIGAMIVMGLILAMIDEYEISKIMKKRPQWMKDKDKPGESEEEVKHAPDIDYVEAAIKLMPDDKEKPEELEEEELSVDYWEDKEK